MNNKFYSRSKWIFLLVIILSITRPSFLAKVYKNLGGLILIKTDLCNRIIDKRAVSYIQRASELTPGNFSTHWLLINIHGISDRNWVIADTQKRKISSESDELEGIKQLLKPSYKALYPNWGSYNCRSVWRTWILGLIEYAQGDWENAVSNYQVGFSLSLGNIPPDILREYYSALAHLKLSSGNTTAKNYLQTAKYFYLSQDWEQASSFLNSLKQSPDLSWIQRCEVEKTLQALSSSTKWTDSVPWILNPDDLDKCTNSIAVTTQPPEKPDWLIPSENNVTSEGKTLLGFDIDEDVLDAGAEIIGLLYWHYPDGQIQTEPFRQFDLWPNSGNEWLNTNGFWPCLPGYREPDWVSSCTSRVDTFLGQQTGYINVFQNLEPDVLLESSSVFIPANSTVVYGGMWHLNGNFPSPHLARNYIAGDPPRYYDIVLGLPSTSNAILQKAVNVIPPLPSSYEYTHWIRPRSGVGNGEVWFDNVFAFILPIIP